QFLVVLAVAVACAAADVSHILTPNSQVPIVRSDYELNPEGNTYKFAYQTGNDIYAQAEGIVRTISNDEAVHEVRGSYSYLSPDGTPVEVTYTAGPEGFVASGSHLPVGPPIPEAIQRSLEYIKSQPQYVEKPYKPL
ncbi:jg10129, partial [Pararge aegeria aegeria]